MIKAIKEKINKKENNKILELFSKREFLIIFLLSISFLVIIIVFNSFVSKEQQFSYLANSFLHGKLYFINNLGQLFDASKFNSQLYWPLGPAPAFILVPFVFLFKIFGLFFYQKYLFLPIVLLVFFLVYKISRHFNYTLIDSWYLAYAFCFASPFLGIILITWSWYFAQLIAVFLSFYLLWEFLNKKRYWMMGFILGLLFLTRITAGLGIILIILDLLFSKLSKKEKAKKIFSLLWPIVLSFIVIVLYDFLRFHNIYETGYAQQILIPSLLKAREYGLISFIHFPGNLYYFLFSAPLPVFRDGLSHVLKFPFIKANPWGLGLFFTAPYLLGIFFKKIKGKLPWFLLITATFIAIPIFLFYGIGFKQFGYRYALDFLPYIFLLFLITYRQKQSKLSTGLKILIISSSIFNLYLFFTLFI